MKAMEMMMRITDNQQLIKKEDFVEIYPKISQVLLDRTLESLSQEDGIFIFPNDLKNTSDLDKEQKIFETVNQNIKTGNVIGFLGYGQGKIKRFPLVFQMLITTIFYIISCRRSSISISLIWMLVYLAKINSINYWFTSFQNICKRL